MLYDRELHIQAVALARILGRAFSSWPAGWTYNWRDNPKEQQPPRAAA